MRSLADHPQSPLARVSPSCNGDATAAMPEDPSAKLIDQFLDLLAAKVAARIVGLAKGTEGAEDRDGPANLDVAAAAEYLSVSVPTVRRFAKQGSLAYVRLGGRLIFRRADLDTFVAERRVEPTRRR